MSRAEVLIPHHNRAEGLRRTLESLRAQTLPASVCVIDNASTDDTPDVLASFPDVRCLRLDRNAGFGAAVNRGARSSEADLIILLNNDAVADSRFVERLVGAQRASGAEMVAGCLREPGGRIDSLGVQLDCSLLAYDHLHGAEYDALPAEVDAPLAPSGGACAYLRDAFLSVGGFDEAIFAYLEDAELGLRMRKEGMRCVAAPGAFAWHEHSGTLGARSAAKNELLGRSRAYLLWKHGGTLGARERARGALVDATVAVGKLAIDHDLGMVRGYLRSWREQRGERRPAPELATLEHVPLARFGLREALRRRLARRSPEAPSP
ncbi:MAG: glycosyltransferase family 2 protein [Solirubrobacterales bacterium]